MMEPASIKLRWRRRQIESRSKSDVWGLRRPKSRTMTNGSMGGTMTNGLGLTWDNSVVTASRPWISCSKDTAVRLQLYILTMVHVGSLDRGSLYKTKTTVGVLVDSCIDDCRPL